jgi:hypothetical protein
MSKEQMMSIAVGEHSVYLYGTIVYSDVFDCYVSRSFRYEHTGKIDHIRDGPKAMKISMRGNEKNVTVRCGCSVGVLGSMVR